MRRGNPLLDKGDPSDTPAKKSKPGPGRREVPGWTKEHALNHDKPKAGMNPRRVALRVLTRLTATPKRLEAILDGELKRQAKAEARDKALAVGLVYAVLRHRAHLDHLLAAFVRRPLASLDPPAWDILRLAAAELTVLGAPAHAVVSQAVDLAKIHKAMGVAGLINASLRALAARWRDVPLPDPAAEPARHLAVLHSHPQWLVEELLERLGWNQTAAWLAADQQAPPLSLRVNPLRTDRQALIALLATHCQTIEHHPLAPDSLILRGVLGRGADLPGFGEGLWQRQDPGATALGHLLGVRPGQRVLDLCAGAGGKTGHLAALMENQGQILAVEPAAGRLRGLGENLARLGVANVRTLEADGTTLDPVLGPFDRILVDAPCTGLGTLGRRPDVRWRRDPADPPRLAALQLALASRAVQLLAPGGALLYCTCTITRAENENVVAALLAAHPGLRLEWDLASAGPAAAALGADGFFRTLPHQHHCDAFFAARLVKG